MVRQFSTDWKGGSDMTQSTTITCAIARHAFSANGAPGSPWEDCALTR